MSCMQFVPVPHHSSVRNTYKRLWSHCPAPTNALAAMPWKKMKLHDVVVDWVWDRHCQIFVWFWNACITWHNPKAFRLYRSSSYLLFFLSSLNSVHYVWEKFTGWISAVHKQMAAAVWLLHYISMHLAIIFVLKSTEPKSGLRTSLNIFQTFHVIT